jgi:RNA recognition motif-containing protein
MTGTLLYVSNLPSSATEAELVLKFGTCGGVVTVRIMLDTSTGRSKRYGFVEMATRADALAAIGRLNLTTYDGRLMSVNLARPEATTDTSQPALVSSQARARGAH